MNEEVRNAISDLKKYVNEHKLRYTKLDRHDKAIEILLNYKDDLEIKLDELQYSYNELKKELQEKKEHCSQLMEHINPYSYYGVSERDFH